MSSEALLEVHYILNLYLTIFILINQNFLKIFFQTKNFINLLLYISLR
jgi:hypothetical protein